MDCYTNKFIEMFHSKYEQGTNDECWIWRGITDRDGYGTIAGKRAHRVALHLHTGDIGDKALHECDRPSCVNPHHLAWGTQKENMNQKKIRGRAAHNRGTTLCSESVKFMREIYDNNQMTIDELSKTFNISYNQTRRILGNFNW